jgi:hypothetical protein
MFKTGTSGNPCGSTKSGCCGHLQALAGLDRQPRQPGPLRDPSPLLSLL